MEQIEPLDAQLAGFAASRGDPRRARRRPPGADRRGGGGDRRRARAGPGGARRAGRRRSTPSSSASTTSCGSGRGASPSPASSVAPAAAATWASPRWTSTASRSCRRRLPRTARSAAASSPAERGELSGRRGPLVRRTVDPDRLGGVPQPVGRLPPRRPRQRPPARRSCPIGEPRLLHALAGAAAALAIVMLAARGRRVVQRRWLGVPIGMLLHLVLDGAWADADAFWWPFLGVEWSTAELPELGRGALQRRARGHRRGGVLVAVPPVPPRRARAPRRLPPDRSRRT